MQKIEQLQQAIVALKDELKKAGVDVNFEAQQDDLRQTMKEARSVRKIMCIMCSRVASQVGSRRAHYSRRSVVDFVFVFANGALTETQQARHH